MRRVQGEYKASILGLTRLYLPHHLLHTYLLHTYLLHTYLLHAYLLHAYLPHAYLLHTWPRRSTAAPSVGEPARK